VRHNKISEARTAKIIAIISLVLFSHISQAQPRRQGNRSEIRLGVHFDPVISWFSTDIETVRNEGARPGFNFGITRNKYFGPNYSFSTGINIISAGGRLVSRETTLFELVNNAAKTVTVEANEAISYKIQYLSVPLGLKLQTNQIGYFTVFSDLGIDPKIVVGGKADIPSLQIKGERATSEIRFFNLSYHVIAGIEYSFGGNTAIVLGLGFDNNFFDITKDTGDQPEDKVSHKLFSFRMGVNF
jgi:Outer membrane protein beta-barrel domain